MIFSDKNYLSWNNPKTPRIIVWSLRIEDIIENNINVLGFQNDVSVMIWDTISVRRKLKLNGKSYFAEVLKKMSCLIQK